MWASSGQTTIDNEIAALKSAITKYGSKFTSLVTGLSVGSEDLYRITPTGLANDPNSVGAGPDVLVSYIKQVRAAVKGTDLENIKIGHVDTWTGWVNGSNSAVVDAVDWLGMNTFPYFQTTDPNSIENGQSLFQAAYDATAGAGKGKPVWVTETGWPVGGKKSGDAVASVANAKTYWEDVGCGLFGKTNTWWYTLVDANTDPTQPEFGIVGTTLSSDPLYDLSCKGFPAKSASTSSKVSEVVAPSEPPSPSPSPAPMSTSEASLMASATTSSSNTPIPQDASPSSNPTSDSPSSSSTSSPEGDSSSSEDLSRTLTLIDTPSTQGSSATSSGSSSQSTGSGSVDSSGTSSTGPVVVTSYFTASPSNSGSGTGSDAATTTGSPSSTASPSTSTTPNAAAGMVPASVGGLVGMMAAILALF